MTLHSLFLNQESSQRNLVCFEKEGLDFEVDLTDLETFGETAPIKTSKMQEMQKEQDVCAKNKKAASRPPSSETKKVGEVLVNTSSSSQEEMNVSLTDVDDAGTDEISRPAASEAAEQSRLDLASTGDSDDEKLVIADSVSPPATPAKQPKPCSANSEPSTPEKATRQRRQSQKAKASGDQLSEILRMQKAMFSSANDAAKCSSVSQEASSSNRCTGPSAQSHPTSLVKPCVSSYLERNQSRTGATCTAPQESAPVVNIANTRHKSKWSDFYSGDSGCVDAYHKHDAPPPPHPPTPIHLAEILSEDLQAGAEDEQDYEAPKEGNLLYKLYSLQDVLLLVRSSVSLTHTRKVGSSPNKVDSPVCAHPPLSFLIRKAENSTCETFRRPFLFFVSPLNSTCQCMCYPSWSTSWVMASSV